MGSPCGDVCLHIAQCYTPAHIREKHHGVVMYSESQEIQMKIWDFYFLHLTLNHNF